MSSGSSAERDVATTPSDPFNFVESHCPHSRHQSPASWKLTLRETTKQGTGSAVARNILTKTAPDSAICAVWKHETAHIALPNGSFCRTKRAISHDETAGLATRFRPKRPVSGGFWPDVSAQKTAQFSPIAHNSHDSQRVKIARPFSRYLPPRRSLSAKTRATEAAGAIGFNCFNVN